MLCRTGNRKHWPSGCGLTQRSKSSVATARVLTPKVPDRVHRVRLKWRIDFISSVTRDRPCSDCWSDWPIFYAGLRYLNPLEPLAKIGNFRKLNIQIVLFQLVLSLLKPERVNQVSFGLCGSVHLVIGGPAAGAKVFDTWTELSKRRCVQ